MVQYSHMFMIVLLAVDLCPHDLVAPEGRKNNPTATRMKPASGSLHVDVSRRRYQFFQAIHVACFVVHNHDKGLLVHDSKIGEILSLSALFAMSTTTNQYAASITSCFITLHRVTPWSSSSAVRKSDKIHIIYHRTEGRPVLVLVPSMTRMESFICIATLIYCITPRYAYTQTSFPLSRIGPGSCSTPINNC